MKDFRRSVIRLFLATFFLLFIAWIGMKAMQYHGDYSQINNQKTADPLTLYAFEGDMSLNRQFKNSRNSYSFPKRSCLSSISSDRTNSLAIPSQI